MSPTQPLRPLNRLLKALAPDDLVRLSAHLKPVALRLRHPLEAPNTKIESVCFVERGIISVVAPRGGVEVEIGLIGYEGVTGLAVIMGNDRSPHSVYVQVDGDGLQIDVSELRTAMAEMEGLRTTLLKYAQAFMVQTADTAVSNARASIEVRLARWLLMAHDRIQAKELPLTHEFLALMMGIRRPGVTEAVHRLAATGMIRHRRGVIVVVDRRALEKRAGPFYGTAEAELVQLFKGTS
jgi:CRP-like cAMP-binding protein